MSVVLCVLNSNCRLGLVDMLVTHANMKGFGLASLSGAHCAFMYHQLKTNKTSKQPKFKASIGNKRNLAQQSNFQEVRL